MGKRNHRMRSGRGLSQQRESRSLSKRLMHIESLETRHMMAAYINEVHYQPGLGDFNTSQYVELRGDANATLPAGTYLVVINSVDSIRELGDISAIFNLSGQQFGSNGMLVLIQAGGGYTVDSSANTLRGTDGFQGIGGGIFTADLSGKALSTNSSTYLLIQSSVAPQLNNDIDINDDGTPEGAYNNWTVLDGFSVINSNESLWLQRSYAPIVFRQLGVGSVSTFGTVVDTERQGYVARIGSSVGYAASDWVVGTTLETAIGNWQYQLQRSNLGNPRPFAYIGRTLDHVGSTNFSGSLSGTVFKDINSDGVRQPGEPPLSGVKLNLDRLGDTNLGVYNEVITAEQFLTGADLTNVSSNFSMVTAGSDNAPQSFIIKPVAKPSGAVGDMVLSYDTIPYFNDSRRLRIDFYRPARAVSVDFSGDSNFTATYGRLELFNAAGQTLGFVRTNGLSAGQRQTITAVATENNIAYAVAYSDNQFLSSSLFGRIEGFTASMVEPTVQTDSQGNFFLDAIGKGDYVLRATAPATFDQVLPAAAAGYTINMNAATAFKNLNFAFVGDTAPVVNDLQVAASESLSAESVIGRLQITRGYPSQQFKASITAGDPTNLFRIDAATGDIVLNRGDLDFETTGSYTLTVRMEDTLNSLLFDTATVQITVNDANDAPRVSGQQVTLTEHSANQTVVATVQASDQDQGAAGTYTWSITSGNVGNAFSIDTNSGVLRVLDAAQVNFETVPEFLLIVRATDQGSPIRFGEATVTVTVSDINEPPQMTNPTLSITENSGSGTSAGIIGFSDPDKNQSVLYEIIGGSGQAVFGIHPNFGEVTLLSGASLNFEAKSSYELIVQVTDTGTPKLSSQKTFTVNVVDANDSPTVTANLNSIPENAIAGTVVGQAVGSDPDAGQTVRYALEGGDALKFSIDSNTGQIRVANGATFDFENFRDHRFSVRVTDNGLVPLSTVREFIVSVTDINEKPSISNQDFVVGENSPAGLEFGTLQATDPDGGETLTFTIVQQTFPWFEVSPSGNKLRVAAGATIDFETNTKNVLTIRVTDRGGLLAEAQTTVTVQDRNDAPTTTGTLADVKVKLGSSVNYTIPNGIFTDVDPGDSLRFVMTTGTGFPIPGWLTFNAQTRTLTGTPTTSELGTLPLRVSAIDNAGANTGLTLNLIVEGNPTPLHNTTRANDCSGDNFVSAFDALLVINQLNTVGPGPVDPNATPVDGWLDTNADNEISAIDALLVINELNTGSPEGESVAAADSVFQAWEQYFDFEGELWRKRNASR